MFSKVEAACRHFDIGGGTSAELWIIWIHLEGGSEVALLREGPPHRAAVSRDTKGSRGNAQTWFPPCQKHMTRPVDAAAEQMRPNGRH